MEQIPELLNLYQIHRGRRDAKKDLRIRLMDRKQKAAIRPRAVSELNESGHKLVKISRGSHFERLPNRIQVSGHTARNDEDRYPIEPLQLEDLDSNGRIHGPPGPDRAWDAGPTRFAGVRGNAEQRTLSTRRYPRKRIENRRIEITLLAAQNRRSPQRISSLHPCATSELSTLAWRPLHRDVYALIQCGILVDL